MGSIESSQAAAGAAVVGIGLLAVAVAVAVLSRTRSGTQTNGKTMKAPGRGDRISRDGFQQDPKSYFRALRNK